MVAPTSSEVPSSRVLYRIPPGQSRFPASSGSADCSRQYRFPRGEDGAFPRGEDEHFGRGEDGPFSRGGVLFPTTLSPFPPLPSARFSMSGADRSSHDHNFSAPVAPSKLRFETAAPPPARIVTRGLDFFLRTLGDRPLTPRGECLQSRGACDTSFVPISSLLLTLGGLSTEARRFPTDDARPACPNPLAWPVCDLVRECPSFQVV